MLRCGILGRCCGLGRFFCPGFHRGGGFRALGHPTAPLAEEFAVAVIPRFAVEPLPAGGARRGTITNAHLTGPRTRVAEEDSRDGLVDRPGDPVPGERERQPEHQPEHQVRHAGIEYRKHWEDIVAVLDGVRQEKTPPPPVCRARGPMFAFGEQTGGGGALNLLGAHLTSRSRPLGP